MFGFRVEAPLVEVSIGLEVPVAGLSGTYFDVPILEEPEVINLVCV